MVIDISLVLGHLLLLAFNFVIPYFIYRYVFYPNYRWSQRGNVCWEGRRNWSIVWMIVLTVIEAILKHTDLTFIW